MSCTERKTTTNDVLPVRSAPLFFTATQVTVCRRCYEVYRRLDKLREKADRAAGETGAARGSSSLVSSPPLPLSLPSKGRGLLASVDATVAGGRRAPAAEAGGVNLLRKEVEDMLKDVDARAGKLGIEAGIARRRRLRYMCTAA